MKNITIDVGNTNIVICSFENNNVIEVLKIKNSELKEKNLELFFLKKNIQKYNIILSSVAPSISRKIENFLNKNRQIFFFLRNIIKYLKIKINIKDKKNIGDDRIVNAYYAKFLYSRNIIIIDFGTATTFDIIDSKGDYDGGIITPGIELSLNSLFESTEKLPLVKFKKTKSVIGKDTKTAIQSGFFWGYISMIRGLVNNIKDEKNDNFKIILTGGNANYFDGLIENVVLNDDLFNSKGLNFIISEYLKKNEYKK